MPQVSKAKRSFTLLWWIQPLGYEMRFIPQLVETFLIRCFPQVRRLVMDSFALQILRQAVSQSDFEE